MWDLNQEDQSFKAILICVMSSSLRLAWSTWESASKKKTKQEIISKSLFDTINTHVNKEEILSFPY